MRCYSCRKYDDCERPWKCDGTMYDCTAYELEQTNDEWRKTCSTEEFAEFIRQQRDDWSDGWYSDCHRFDEILEWLKQPHNSPKWLASNGEYLAS